MWRSLICPASYRSLDVPACLSACLPTGYRAVGDVLALGLEPPVAPVPCFRDDIGLRIRWAPLVAYLNCTAGA
jgi:hypothetical protein